MTPDDATGRSQTTGQVWSYFMDESGNSRDLTFPGADFTFDDQEDFVLTVVGVQDLEGCCQSTGNPSPHPGQLAS